MKRTTHTIRVLSLLLTLAVLFCSYTFIATAQQADITQTEESPISATQSDGKFLNEISFEGTGEYIYAVYELNDRREENVKHFSMPDGTYRAVVYGEAVHRLGADGKWADIDNSLNLTRKNGMSLYSDAEGRISFAGSAQPSAQGSFLFSLTENGYMLAMALKGNTNGSGSINLGSITASASVAAVTNPAAKEALTPEDSAELQFEKLSAVDNQTEIFYADILSGTDLEYTLRSNSIKENIVVKSPQASYVYSFEVATKGLTAALSDDGSITLSDSETNTSVYYIPAPYMTDADGNVSHDVSYSLTELSEGSYELTVTASAEWINAQDRSFPVKIDPTVMSRSGIHDTYISNLVDEATSSEYGNEDYLSLMPEFLDENGVLRRTIGLIRGDLPSIPETAIVTNASLIMNLSFPGQTSGEAVIIARNITAPWNEDDASWWPECNNIGLDATMVSTQITSASSKLVSLDITPFVQAANCITANYHGVALFNAALPNGGEIRIKSSEASENYLITTVTYVDGIEEGVYSIKNLTTNKWLTTPINSGDYTDFSAITQKTFSADPTANFDNSREALFKISIIPGTTRDRYVLRPMLNNNFVVNYYGGELVPMFTSAQESSFTDDQTFYIEATANGYTIKTVSSEETVFASDTSNSVDISYEFESGEIWQFTRYDGTEKYGVGFNDHPNDVVVGTSVEIVPVVWSTVISAHTPLVRVQTSDQSIATYSWNSSAQKMTLNPISEGIVQTVIVLYKGDNIYRSVTSKVFSLDVRLPVESGTYFVRNVHSKHYLQIDDADASNNFSTNNAGLEVWEYDGEDYQKWYFYHISNGEYFIVSEKSSMALTMPTAEQDNTLYPALLQSQFNPDLSTQKWKISITESGNYRISSVSDVTGNTAMGTLTTDEGTAVRNISFECDDMFCDEWYISEKSFDCTLRIDVCADLAYTERYPSYDTRIHNIFETVSQKYLNEFGILIIDSGITVFRSSADYCDEISGGDYITPCTCVTDEQCINASSSGMHHNRDRLYISTAPEASLAKVVAFSGHDICRTATREDENGNSQTVHSYNSLGSTLALTGICIVNDFRDNGDDDSLNYEISTTVHEIGHFYGAPDHNTAETTAYLNSLFPEGENPFADSCIYGVNNNEHYETIAMPICEGCKYLIQVRKYMYDS